MGPALMIHGPGIDVPAASAHRAFHRDVAVRRLDLSPRQPGLRAVDLAGELNWMTAAAASSTPSAPAAAELARVRKVSESRAGCAAQSKYEETEPGFAHVAMDQLPLIEERGNHGAGRGGFALRRDVTGEDAFRSLLCRCADGGGQRHSARCRARGARGLRRRGRGRDRRAGLRGGTPSGVPSRRRHHHPCTDECCA